MIDPVLGMDLELDMNENEQGWKRYYNKEVNAKATKKFRKEKMRSISIAFHKENEADLLTRIDEEDNKAGYIKQLIRDDIIRTGWKPKTPPPVSTLPPVEPVPTRPYTPPPTDEDVRKAWGIE